MVLLKLLRYTIGQLIVLIDLLVPVKKISRSEAEQQKAMEKAKSLSLYQFHLCPFCVRVRREMRRLNINIELKDAKDTPVHREALLTGGGKLKVPCLRIEKADQEVEWMYESLDINTYLKKQFQTCS